MNKQDFISKWSNFWLFQPDPVKLNGIFRRELDLVIENEVKNNKEMLDMLQYLVDDEQFSSEAMENEVKELIKKAKQ